MTASGDDDRRPNASIDRRPPVRARESTCSDAASHPRGGARAHRIRRSGDNAAVAQRALVSEATAYRYFADLPALVREALGDLWPPPDEMLRAIDPVDDPVKRVTFAAQALLTRVLRYEGSTRAMIAATIAGPKGASERPGYRFGLIDRALDPVADAFQAHEFWCS